MKRAEVERKFDEIVAFAEIEKFLDIPVKRYSSGMQVRLAFSIAAHLEPEILLVDEVLAVGDAEFQRKCLGKMDDVAQEGRTVLFVSHNMPSILRLCSRAILFQAGYIDTDGSAQTVVDKYLVSHVETVAEVRWDIDEAPGNEIARIKSVCILGGQGQLSHDHYLSQPITLEMEFWCLRPDVRLNPCFHVYNTHGVCVFNTSNLEDVTWGATKYASGLYRSRCVIPGHLLNEGQYRVSAIVVQDINIVLARQEQIVSFQVHDDGSGRGDYTGVWIGVIRPLLSWKVEQIGGAP